MKERYQSRVAVFLILMRETNGEKEVLLQRRCNTGYKDGEYDAACSGPVEAGESISAAVVREASEAIGIEVTEYDLKLVQVIHAYKENYLNAFFTVDNYKGVPEIKEKDKCDDLNWFKVNDLPENTIYRIRNVIDNMQKGILYDDSEFTHKARM